MAVATITGPVYGVSQVYDFIEMNIVFELSYWDKQEDVGLIASGPIIVPVDANGDFSVDLMINSGGDNFTHYQCFLQYRRTDGTEWIREPIGMFTLTNTGTFPISNLEITPLNPPHQSAIDVYSSVLSIQSSIAQLTDGAADEALASAALALAHSNTAEGHANDASGFADAAAASAASIDVSNFSRKDANLGDLVSVTAAKTNLGLGTAADSDTGDFATAAQGALADNALPSSSKATNAEGLAGTNNTKYMTPLTTKNAIEATTISKSYTDVSSSRFPNTAYQNTATHDMHVFCRGNGGVWEVSEDNITWVLVNNAGNYPVSFVVGPSHYYRLNGSTVSTVTEYV